MLIIGLTGPTGAGKSTVGKILTELGFHHIDGDLVSREVTVAGSDALCKIKEAFGSSVINEDGSLNRKLLGEIVFSNSDKLKLLNSIIHKYITYSINEKIKELNKTDCKGVIIDGAALFESSISDICDVIIAVISEAKKRRSLVMARDSIDAAQADRRISAQKSDKFYTNKADYIICNDSTIEELRKKTEDIAAKIMEDI